MSDDTNPLCAELEILRASYGPELEISAAGADVTQIRFQATPNVGLRSEEWCFAATELFITFPASYPTSPAQFSLSKSRGLESAQIRELEELLQSDAKERSIYGEVHVFSALQRIEEFLADRNSPNPCPVCIEEVEIDGSGEEAPLQLRPCLHVMHMACYRGYRSHIEERRREKEASLVHREGPSKAARLAKIHWALCPVCRIDFDFENADELLITHDKER